MTKKAPAAQDERLALQTVADASREVGETCSAQDGTIFDDLSLIGALLFGEPMPEMIIDEVAPERRH
jgi:hypothetical protein